MSGQVKTLNQSTCVQSAKVPTGTKNGEFLIYKVTNQINGKVYIGQTSVTLTKRKAAHVNKTKSNSSTFFHNAIRKNGIESFTWEVVHSCYSKEEANEKECEFIKTLGCKFPAGYNLTDGGEGTIGYRPTEEKNALMSRLHKGNKHALGCKHSAEANALKSERQKGKKGPVGRKHTEESKAKMSKILLGNKRMTGYKMPEEIKEKISKGMKGKQNCLGNKLTDEHKAKVSALLKGCKRSDETRVKMSIASKERMKIRYAKEL